MSTSFTQEADWVPLLVPDVPSPEELLPWLDRMHAARHYSNFGPLVRELETVFAGQFGVPEAQVTTVANATLGMELVLQALELPPGSRVLVPAFTFVATATAVVRAGHVPVLTDIDEDCWMLTPAMAYAACAQKRVDAVLTVATFGMPHDMQAWQQFEAKTGLPVVIDAAAAYGSQWLKSAQGTLVFSLHATKSLPAVEGGLVVSSRPGLVAKVRQLSNFGINLDPAAPLPLGALAQCGTNAKMSEYHAAICLASLLKWEQHAQERRALQQSHIQSLGQAAGQRLHWQQQGSGGALMAPTLLCARLPDTESRDRLEAACRQARIMTRRWYLPLLQHMPALERRSEVMATPNAHALASTLLGLPFFLSMSQAQHQRVLKQVRESFAAMLAV